VKLLLAFMLGMVLIGLFTERLGAKTYGLIGASAVAAIVLYFGLTRFMT